jgi:hypothetical protein
MTEIKVKDLLYITEGNVEVVIYNIKNNEYKELWRDIVDDIDFNDIPYGDSTIVHLTVVNGESVLQIHINYED